MAITTLTIPSQTPTRYNSPYDKALELTLSETLTATGYFGSTTTTTTLDLGGATPVSAVGRTEFMWNVLISAIDMSSVDETYRGFLMGSNDAAWGNGNQELLAAFDLAAAVAGRIVPTILGISQAIPPTNVAGTLIQKPVTNLFNGNLFRYIRGYWVLGGTTPSITYRSWLSKAMVDV